MVLSLAALRVRLIYKMRRERLLVARWRPLFARACVEVPQSLPPLARRDRLLFLHLWNHYRQSLRGEVERNLNELGGRVGIERVAKSLLRRRGVRPRLLGATALGYLRSESAWPDLLKLARDVNPILALAAARALVAIDPRAAVRELMPLISSRHDWSYAQAAKLLSEAGREVIATPLLTALKDAPKSAQRRLLWLVQILGVEGAGPYTRAILRRTRDNEVIAAALRTLARPADVALVRVYVRHPEAFVRISAAQALGRLGRREDVPLLTLLLGDREWWVRYRAAQALCSLPFVSAREIVQIRERLQDRYARDMLAHVASEQPRKA